MECNEPVDVSADLRDPTSLLDTSRGASAEKFRPKYFVAELAED